MLGWFNNIMKKSEKKTPKKPLIQYPMIVFSIMQRKLCNTYFEPVLLSFDKLFCNILFKHLLTISNEAFKI